MTKNQQVRKSSRILVTGGAGCIGSELVRVLLNRGDEVIVIDNLSSGRLEHIEEFRANPRFRFEEADILDSRALDRVLEGVDAVHHLAANPDVKFTEDAPDRDLKQNVIATSGLLDAMRRHGVKELAFSSTSAVYGMSPVQPIPEDQPCCPISLYGATKLGCEGLIHAHAHLFGIQAWIFRFANVVGGKVRKTGKTVVSDFIAKLKSNPTSLEILGNGQQAKSYIMVDECVAAMLHVIEHTNEPVNVYNLGGDDWLSVTRIAELVIEAMKLENVELRYTGGHSGWPGDVPRFRLDVSRLNGLGWKVMHTSESAIRFAIQQILPIS